MQLNNYFALLRVKQFEAMSLLWSNIRDSEIDQLPLPKAERDLIDARMAAYKSDPSRASSWPEAQQRIKASLAASRKQ